MAEFIEWTRGGGVVVRTTLLFWEFRILLSLLVREVGGVGVAKCWQVKVTGERVFMDHLECMGDVWIEC